MMDDQIYTVHESIRRLDGGTVSYGTGKRHRGKFMRGTVYDQNDLSRIRLEYSLESNTTLLKMELGAVRYFKAEHRPQIPLGAAEE